MSAARKKSTDKMLESNAPPPWHAVALLGAFGAVFGRTFPSLQAIDGVATHSVFRERVFPELVSIEMLGCIRLACAVFMLSVSVYSTFLYSGWVQTTTYLSKSKLKRNVPIEMRGFRTQLPFTSWSWNLLGLSFFLNGIILFLDEVPPWLLRLSLLVFEAAAPCALLVACVVRYAIWPRVFQQHGTAGTAHLASPLVLIWHNVNVIFVLLEVSVWGKLPIQWRHFAVCPMFGILYVLFSWSMRFSWVDPSQAGPQFIYFFFDTTLGWTTSLALLVLLVVLTVFYGLFEVLDHVLGHLQGGILVHLVAAAFVCSLVCRFRD